MINLFGYEVKEEIYSGEKSLVFRGEKDGQPVIIKILRNEYPEPVELSVFKQEYEILEKIQSFDSTRNSTSPSNATSIVRVLGLEKYKNSFAIIFEDIKAEALSRIRNFSLNEIIAIMVKSAYALGEVHNQGIVHKDIKPHNIVFNQDTSELQIIDFGNASHLAKQNSYTPLNSSLEGTLAYISPEQTGRMNRTVDYRTDYYSLGVTFYQLLTGKLPFIATDPMELVHAHIAKMPIAPIDSGLASAQLTKQRVGAPLSDIIMKLLQKNPEDRYQSIAGLVYDLEWCLNNINPIGVGDDFQIATHDFSGKFQIPEKLYGRTKEINQILDTFKEMVGGNGVETHCNASLQIISGRSGIGKSALINEVNKPITQYKGFFATGKYDQFKRTIPFLAISQAFQNLIQQVLTGNQEEIIRWKSSLLNAIGSNGRVIIDVIPELETLIGEQPPVAELGSMESQNRFNLVFQNFIRAFCSKEHPIAIFLDDLQWADNPSISLIQTILSNPEMKYLYLILSFRDNEVYTTDTFSLMLQDLKKSGFTYKEILLDPISALDISHLVSDTLSCENARAKELAEILFEKTKGNPFFVNELFKSLYDKDLIGYKENVWQWDISKIREVKISENVIDLMVEKVKELKLNQIELLKLAACVGDSFRIDIFAGLTNQEIDVVSRELINISNEGFLILTKEVVRFVHDKVREATYSLTTEEERAKNHYAIGNNYLKITKETEIDDVIFAIVNQLNQGISLLSEEEKSRLIDLNILAGDKALASAAYDVALNLYHTTIELLPENSWEILYDKTFEVYLKLARLEYLNGNPADAETHFDITLNKAKTILNRVIVSEYKIPLYVGQNRPGEALEEGIKALEMLGVSFPYPLDPTSEIAKTNLLLAGKEVEDLLKLPSMTDLNKSASMRILSTLIVSAIVYSPAHLPIIILKKVNLSLEFGNYLTSPIAYAFYGVLLCNAFGNVETGIKFGKLAVTLVDMLSSNSTKCSTYFIFATLVNHWKNHAKENIPYYLTAIQAGLEYGDFAYGSYSSNHFIIQSFLMRKNLTFMIEYYERYYKDIMLKFNLRDAIVYYQMFHQLAINLKGDAKDILVLNGTAFDEFAVLPIWLEAKDSGSLASYFPNKAILAYMFGSSKDAYNFFQQKAPYEGSGFGFMLTPEHIFFESLTCLALLEAVDTPDADKVKYKEQIIKNQESMKVWGENCPANYGHKYYIVEGELASLNKDKLKTLECFDTAIVLAKEHEYTLEEAIANELYAKFWEKEGKENYKKLHLQEAHYAYKKWGCEPKVKQLEEKYPHLKRHAAHGINSDASFDTAMTVSIGSISIGTSTVASSFLDLNTVIKASQTISGEIQLGKLLEKMMTILFENAGAERGFFILKEKENWLIEAEGNANTGMISVLEAKPLEDNSDLSPNIVNYVILTKSIVLLDDAVKKGIFVNDTYIKTNSPKSILCYPILNQGNLIGIVYLENNLTTDAFTPDRLEILKILSAQIAVSLENSLLYANLEEKVGERTIDLNRALVEVRGLKEQQDGDYFLNTLLIEPLGQNNAFSKMIDIEFFVRQKKNFIFRNAEYELGGDVNISENIKLQSNNYIVFLNGDAMGKSIQGAGGVLVLGTVFKSIIQRTVSTDYGERVYPERWLKNTFIEMHKAFESFDGAMLMSAVLGLIDERTGTMYFLSAEHPDIVLYRDGVASFIENPNQYRKLGTQGQTGSISIEVFSILPGDIVILGSDGRDDIILGRDIETGKEIMNRDETLFLSHVETGEGDLAKIYESIITTGTPMDDLSLFKIHYSNTKVNEDKLKLEEILKLLVNYKDEREYEKFLELSQKLIADYPHLTNYMFEVSSTYKELKQYEKAVEFAERVRLREPRNLTNLVVLIESYSCIGESSKAQGALDVGLRMNPEDARLNKIKQEFGK